MEQASKTYYWDLNLSEIARIWTNGCIIRSKFMEQSITVFKEHKSYLADSHIIDTLKSSEDHIKESISNSLSRRMYY